MTLRQLYRRLKIRGFFVQGPFCGSRVDFIFSDCPHGCAKGLYVYSDETYGCAICGAEGTGYKKLLQQLKQHKLGLKVG